MCDSLVVRHRGRTWFAKNSDREAAEPQRLIRIPEVRGDRRATLMTTYQSIAQTAERHGLLLSQPSWMWGGEMGVNDRGVAIGNQAVFTKLTQKNANCLLGMDLVRLGLERGATAREALEVIVEHIHIHGQGGAAGYRNKSYRYDNSFLIADPHEAWVLETAGHLWVAKCVEQWAISNALTLGSEFDLHSPRLHEQARKLDCWDGKGEFHFARIFDTRLLPWIAGAQQRCQANKRVLDTGAESFGFMQLAAALRNHGDLGDNFPWHNNRQVCMHAGKVWRPSQTTSSLLASLDNQGVSVAATATSAPCLSLFQPLSFEPSSGAALLSDPLEPIEQSLWWRFEAVHRRCLADSDFRVKLRASRDQLEPLLLSALGQQQIDWPKLADLASHWHQYWHAEAIQQPAQLGRWWRRYAQL
ncbi:C69 family dipeptidase [Pseudomonas segetis]|uniref:Dipeptidase n=1 Tax=Pseudomonas segetis TaxID=298908 RepID=A0A238Z645_9PSED|nr:C69 family dipeptidase [Pseudomonas segetis]SNR78886.1 Dipeptidase [Pseudomonas segetis]